VAREVDPSALAYSGRQSHFTRIDDTSLVNGRKAVQKDNVHHQISDSIRLSSLQQSAGARIQRRFFATSHAKTLTPCKSVSGGFRRRHINDQHIHASARLVYIIISRLVSRYSHSKRPLKKSRDYKTYSPTTGDNRETFIMVVINTWLTRSNRK
jgi:hypothetical protein